MRFHGRVGDFVGNVARFRDVVGLGETFLRIAKGVVVFLLNVAWLVLVDEVALGFHRFFRIEISGQEFVLHVNQLQRLLGNVF